MYTNYKKNLNKFKTTCCLTNNSQLIYHSYCYCILLHVSLMPE